MEEHESDLEQGGGDDRHHLEYLIFEVSRKSRTFQGWMLGDDHIK